jgi:hypothetical protein
MIGLTETASLDEIRPQRDVHNPCRFHPDIVGTKSGLNLPLILMGKFEERNLILIGIQGKRGLAFGL